MADRDDLAAGSPEWWLGTLESRLRARREQIQLYGDYYEGEHRLMFSSYRFKHAFGDLLSQLRDNWTQLVVDAVAERLKVQGFRWGQESPGDSEASDIWQASHMDAESTLAHTEAITLGESYAMVNPFVPDGGRPEITIEHPKQMIVANEPGSRWKRLAALKVWTDDYGDELATLYLPEGIYKYRAVQSEGSKLVLPPGVKLGKWAPREVDGEDWPLPNPLGVVPVVPLVNRPRMLKPGTSEIANVVPNQDAVNKLLADMLVASEFGAFPQRHLIGMKLEADPLTGELKLPFDIGADRLWVVEDPEAKFGEFQAADLSNYVRAIENRIQAIASQTRTPPHYFYLRGEFPSGESIKSAETGLVAKVRDKMQFFGEAWEEVIRLAFRAMGDPRGEDVTSETIWGDPESRTESEMVDAAVKLKSIGVANEMLQERVGMSPAQIRRNRTLIQQEALEVGAAFDPFAEFQLNGQREGAGQP